MFGTGSKEGEESYFLPNLGPFLVYLPHTSALWEENMCMEKEGYPVGPPYFCKVSYELNNHAILSRK